MTELLQNVFAVLSILGLGVLFVLLVAAVASLAGAGVLRDLADALSGAELLAGFIVSLIAVLGSLYFSEIADYVPCELCWFQRIFMYPLVLLLLAGLIRRERSIAPYATVLSAVGAAFSIYHYQLERFPEQATICTQGVPCTFKWFEIFGFVTIPFLALVAFLLVGSFTALAWWNERREATGDDAARSDVVEAT